MRIQLKYANAEMVFRVSAVNRLFIRFLFTGQFEALALCASSMRHGMRYLCGLLIGLKKSVGF